MIVEMENYKFEVKRVTHLKAIDTITPFLASNINKKKYSCFWVTEIVDKTRKLISE